MLSPRVTLAVLTTAIAAVASITPPPASAAVTCAKWAATTGSDQNPGTQAAPFRSLDKLANALAPGQAGCLPAGATYFAVEGNGIIRAGSGTAASPLTITSGPGGRAIVKGQIWLTATSHDLTFTAIDFRGEYGPSGAPVKVKGQMITAHGDRIAFTDNDISDPLGICLGAGRGHATDASINDVAEDLRVTANRIHDCGMDPSVAWNDSDSGAHGIYLENTLRARISDNVIYRNRYRGLQLWPRNDGALIERNLFDENSTHINIGSSLGEYGGSFKAQNTTVRDNIMSGRVTTYQPSKNPSQLYGFFPAGSPTYGNQVAGNCFAPGDATATGNGYALGANTTAQAQFTNRASRDYRLLSSSPCLGKGPASIQPAPLPAPTPAPSADNTAPVLSSVKLPTSTTKRAITITLSATDNIAVSEVRFANEDGNWAAWQPYATQKPWTLSPNAGYKGVFAQVRDAARNESKSVYTRITCSAPCT